MIWDGSFSTALSVDNVDNSSPAFAASVESFRFYLILTDILRFLSDGGTGKNYPHIFSTENVDKYVDNVDNLPLEQVFAHIYHISGPHSYQHISRLACG